MAKVTAMVRLNASPLSAALVQPLIQLASYTHCLRSFPLPSFFTFFLIFLLLLLPPSPLLRPIGLTFDSDSAQDILPTVAGGELLDTDRLSDSLTLRVIGSIIPLTRTYDPEGRFLVRDGEPLVVAQPGEHGILWRTFHSLKRVLSWPARVAARALGWEHMRATPLLAVLVIVETTDMVFAADSIPAVLSITQDPFIAYTSNIFAVLGLRALYFALAAAMTEFVYLAPALGFILIFIGAKLLLVMVGVHVSVEATLTLVLVVLVLAVALSLLRGRASGHKRR